MTSLEECLILGIRKVVQMVMAKQTNAVIVLNALFPCGENADDPKRVRKETGNGIIRSFADGTRVAWLGFNAKSLDGKRKVDAVATAVGLSDGALEHFEKRFVGDGLDSALERKEREAPPRKIAFGGEFETQLVKLACPVAPDGRSRWTVRLLGDKLTEPKIVDSVSTMIVHNTLKNELKPRLCRRRKSSPENDASYVAAMEDVLKAYSRPHDPGRPVVCMDESSKRLFGEIRDPMPMRPGENLRVNDECERKGVVEIFKAEEPKQCSDESGLAVYDFRCRNETEAPISETLEFTMY